jgi:hypothetical protein
MPARIADRENRLPGASIALQGDDAPEPGGVAHRQFEDIHDHRPAVPQPGPNLIHQSVHSGDIQHATGPYHDLRVIDDGLKLQQRSPARHGRKSTRPASRSTTAPLLCVTTYATRVDAEGGLPADRQEPEADRREAQADEREIALEIRLSVADRRDEYADMREHQADRREADLAGRESDLARREAAAAERDTAAHERQRVADDREQLADERDQVYDRREAALEAREDAADQREIDAELVLRDRPEPPS